MAEARANEPKIASAKSTRARNNVVVRNAAHRAFVVKKGRSNITEVALTKRRFAVVAVKRLLMKALLSTSADGLVQAQRTGRSFTLKVSPDGQAEAMGNTTAARDALSCW